jgi:hypothetical protein
MGHIASEKEKDGREGGGVSVSTTTPWNEGVYLGLRGTSSRMILGNPGDERGLQILFLS